MAVVLIAVVSGALGVLGSFFAERFLSGRIPLLGSFTGLELSHNPGVAFGVHFPPAVQEILIAAALLAVLWLAVRTVRSRQSQKLQAKSYKLAYGLILGGGIANIIDRLPDGLVTDYFQIGTFPVFNVADSCITIGVIILMWEMLGSSGKRKVERGK